MSFDHCVWRFPSLKLKLNAPTSIITQMVSVYCPTKGSETGIEWCCYCCWCSAHWSVKNNALDHWRFVIVFLVWVCRLELRNTFRNTFWNQTYSLQRCWKQFFVYVRESDTQNNSCNCNQNYYRQWWAPDPWIMHSLWHKALDRLVLFAEESGEWKTYDEKTNRLPIYAIEHPSLKYKVIP